MTPAINTENNEFFLATHSAKLLGNHFQIAPNEPHSPAWGHATSYFQPKSRAEDLPPVSILKHQHVPTERITRSRAGSFSDIREESLEKAIKSAEWTVEPAEQGNGGLRNAIYAATESGKIEDKTWVSLDDAERSGLLLTKILQVGTLGMPTDALEEGQKADIEDRLKLWPLCLLQTDRNCLTQKLVSIYTLLSRLPKYSAVFRFARSFLKVCLAPI